MSRDVTMPTFETTVNRVLTTVVEAGLSQAYKKGERLERGLKRLNLLFYRHMAQKIIGASAAPNLGPYTPKPWKGLSTKYVSKKGHDRFFEKTGALAAWLNEASAAEILGDPEVTLHTKEGKVGDIQGFQRTIIRTSTRGKKWVQTLTFADFKSTGVRGFIKTSELIQYLRPFLKVQVFSKIPAGFADSSSVARWITGGQPDANSKRVAYKLMNFKGREDRPIVSYYLGWWLEVKAKRLIEKFGKV